MKPDLSLSFVSRVSLKDIPMVEGDYNNIFDTPNCSKFKDNFKVYFN